MKLLVRSFFRHGVLGCILAGVAVASAMLAVASYASVMARVRSQVEVATSGNMPADGCFTSYSGNLGVLTQEQFSSVPGVTAVEFTAVANVVMQTGPGTVEGLSFGGSRFRFELARGRLPSGPGEIVLDASLADVAGIEVGDVLRAKISPDSQLALEVVGVLAETSLAPRGVLADRDFCLNELKGSLCRCWVWAEEGRADDIMRQYRSIVPSSTYVTPTVWRERYSARPGVGYTLTAVLLGVLMITMVVMLWLLGALKVQRDRRLLRTAHALGLALGKVRLLLVLDGLYTGMVAVLALALLGAILWFRSLIPAWAWVTPMAFVLPVITMWLAGFGMSPESGR